MKKIGKWLAVCVLALIVVATLCACGDNNGNKPSGVEGCYHVDLNGDGICDKCDSDIPSGCDHKDKNNDEICDYCGENVVASFNIFAINDLHGMYCDTDNQPGVDELTTYLKNYQSTSNTIVLSSGDMWQGSTESNNTKGKLATEWLNYVDCSSMTLGNHEFDWSTEKIRTNAQLANFPFLAINVFDRTTNKRVDYCEASVVVRSSAQSVTAIRQFRQACARTCISRSVTNLRRSSRKKQTDFAHKA